MIIESADEDAGRGSQLVGTQLHEHPELNSHTDMAPTKGQLSPVVTKLLQIHTKHPDLHVWRRFHGWRLFYQSVLKGPMSHLHD